MKTIPLTRGKVVIVDDGDYPELNKHKWYAHKGRYTFYAGRSKKNYRKKQIILMHREILNLKFGDGIKSDHKDGNGLNNCRYNLRSCSVVQNDYNKRSYKNSSSIFKGVFWNKERKRWDVQIKFNGKRHHLGRFYNEIEAAKCYNIAAKQHFGEFAYLNVV